MGLCYLSQVTHQQGNPALNPAEGPPANVYVRLVYITAADCAGFYKMLAVCHQLFHPWGDRDGQKMLASGRGIR